MIDLPPPPCPSITIQQVGAFWRVTRSDGLFEGLFMDRRLALREAIDELEAHRGASETRHFAPRQTDR
jgi:hypothetical protein